MVGRFDEVRPRAVRWVGSSKDDLSRFPARVRRHMGRALWEAQAGSKVAYAKPLKGFAGAGVLEIVSDFDGDTFRAVYTVRFSEAVYVLHAFQKKSKRGIAMPRMEVQVVRQRLRQVREDHERWVTSVETGSR